MTNIISRLLFAAAAMGSAAQVASAQDDVETGETATPEVVVHREVMMTGRLTIPDELYPVVTPYMDCRRVQSGIPNYVNGKLLEPPSVPQDCEALRTIAMEESEQILRSLQIGGNDEERGERLAQIFLQIDEFVRPPSQEELKAMIQSRYAAQ